MTTPPTPAEDTSPAPAMPTSARVAVIVMAVLAALLLLSAGLTWAGYDAAVDRLVNDFDFTREEASRFVLLSIAPPLVIGVLLALSAWFLPRRRPWARWIGLAAYGILTFLALFQIIAAGGVTISSLLLLILSVAAVTSLVVRTTGAYVPRLRQPT